MTDSIKMLTPIRTSSPLTPTSLQLRFHYNPPLLVMDFHRKSMICPRISAIPILLIMDFKQRFMTCPLLQKLTGGLYRRLPQLPA